jgi:hypothetical protein
MIVKEKKCASLYIYFKNVSLDKLWKMMYLYSFFTTLSSTYISLSVYHLQDCLGYCEEFKKWRRHSYQMTYYLRGEISSLLIMTQGGGFEVS